MRYFGEGGRRLSYGSYLAVPANWRARHLLMVERHIGTKPGTGGSTGTRYLRATLDKRFYPLLWEARSAL